MFYQAKIGVLSFALDWHLIQHWFGSRTSPPMQNSWSWKVVTHFQHLPFFISSQPFNCWVPSLIQCPLDDSCSLLSDTSVPDWMWSIQARVSWFMISYFDSFPEHLHLIEAQLQAEEIKVCSRWTFQLLSLLGGGWVTQLEEGNFSFNPSSYI